MQNWPLKLVAFLRCHSLRAFSPPLSETPARNMLAWTWTEIIKKLIEDQDLTSFNYLEIIVVALIHDTSGHPSVHSECEVLRKYFIIFSWNISLASCDKTNSLMRFDWNNLQLCNTADCWNEIYKVIYKQWKKKICLFLLLVHTDWSFSHKQMHWIITRQALRA